MKHQISKDDFLKALKTLHDNEIVGCMLLGCGRRKSALLPAYGNLWVCEFHLQAYEALPDMEQKKKPKSKIL